MDDLAFQQLLKSKIDGLSAKPDPLRKRNPQELVRTYRALRDMKSDIDKEAATRTKPIKALMGHLEAYLLEQLQAAGAKSFSTDSGTVNKKTNNYVKVEDWGVFLAWAQENERFAMLKRDVTKTEILQFLEESGELPPGIKLTQELVVNVSKPR